MGPVILSLTRQPLGISLAFDIPQPGEADATTVAWIVE